MGHTHAPLYFIRGGLGENMNSVIWHLISKEVKDLTGKDWRVVISQSLLFMWAKAIDLMLEGEESKWFDQGEICDIFIG